MELTPEEIAKRRRLGLLRTGYTTGTCATAATKAALLALLGNKQDEVIVTLPKGDKIKIKIHRCNIISSVTAEASVIKDGGDDPDVTHGAEIIARVTLTNDDEIEVDGGVGVGRVTKPGLGLEIGKAAINPTPMKVIKNAIHEVLGDKGVKVVISVPNGDELAKKTDNPRLGIIGGISILGTTGIVIPYSTASFTASIRQCLDVAKAMNNRTVVLTTGERSEDFSKAILDLPDHCFIQMGDFAAYTIRQASMRDIKRVIIAGFIGKLSKIAMGVKQTHVKGSKVDMEFLADLPKAINADSKVIEEIRGANTARHVSEIIMKHDIKGYFDLICEHVCKKMSQYVVKEMEIGAIMFDFNGRVIGQHRINNIIKYKSV